MSERRLFSRVIFSSPATLSAGDQEWNTHLIDLSLKGALLARPDNWSNPDSANLLLTFTLSGSDIELTMEVTLCHEHPEHLGLHCHHIDIESATHLKRLVQLNVGDDALLHREIDQLVSAHMETD